MNYFTVSMLKESCTFFELLFKSRDSKAVLMSKIKEMTHECQCSVKRIITPSSSDAMALVAVCNGEILSWLFKFYISVLFRFDFVTWFCHNLNRQASFLRNVLTGNQTA